MLKENFILVENINETAISAILSNLADLYSDTGFTHGIELSRHATSNRKFLVTFRNNPDFDRFAYFVNYIHYPADVEVLGIFVKGFYQIKEVNATIDFKSGEWLQLYVSKNDTEYDNVSIVNADNKEFLYDFGGKIKNLGFTEERYHLPSIDKNEYSLITVINPSASSSTNSSQEHAKPWWKFW